MSTVRRHIEVDAIDVDINVDINIDIKVGGLNHHAAAQKSVIVAEA